MVTPLPRSRLKINRARRDIRMHVVQSVGTAVDSGPFGARACHPDRNRPFRPAITVEGCNRVGRLGFVGGGRC